MASSNSNIRRRNGLVGGGIVLLLVVVVAVVWAIQAQRDTTGDEAKNPGESSTPSATAGESTSPDATPGGSGEAGNGKLSAAPADTYGLGIGDPEAPVKVEVFEDFQCPFCMQYETASREKLHQAAADGDAYVVYRPFAFLNDYSERALNAFGVVLDASGGKVALTFHDLLYDHQPSEAGPWPSNDDLVDLAVRAGAVEADVRPGIENGDFDQWVVNGNDDTSKRGVRQTPTVFVDGESVSGNSIQEMVENTLTAIGED